MCHSILLSSSSLWSSLFTKIRTVNLTFNALRARGLRARQEGNEPVAGYFSHIGDLYNVHHFWGKLLNKSRGLIWPLLTSHFDAYRARGLRARQEGNEIVAGFFSHVGDLYNAHHFWGKWQWWAERCLHCLFSSQTRSMHCCLVNKMLLMCTNMTKIFSLFKRKLQCILIPCFSFLFLPITWTSRRQMLKLNILWSVIFQKILICFD